MTARLPFVRSRRPAAGPPRFRPSVLALEDRTVPSGTFPTTVFTTSSAPSDIATGADGNLWFATLEPIVGRITPAGVVTTYNLSHTDTYPEKIAAGPDGNVWFTEASGNKIGRITPTGVIAEFTVPGPVNGQSGLTAGPDGNVWFTEGAFSSAAVAKIDVHTGAVTTFALPAPSHPTGITTGPDGNLWVVDGLYGVGTPHIDRVTPAGGVTQFALPANIFPEGAITSFGGALWFSVLGPFVEAARITTIGVVTPFNAVDSGIPGGITGGPDGNVWVADLYGNLLRIAPDGITGRFNLPDATNQYLGGIAVGPDGNLWTASRSGQIDRLRLVGSGPQFCLTLHADGSLDTQTGTQPVTLTVFGVNGARDAAYRGRVHFTSSDPRAVLPADYTFTAADAGQHVFSVTLESTLESLGGPTSITAREVGGSLDSTLTDIMVYPGPVAQLDVTGLPTRLAAGSSASFTVTPLDAFGNTTWIGGDTIHFSRSGTAADSDVPPDYRFSPQSSEISHTFDPGVEFNRSGVQTLTVTDLNNPTLSTTVPIMVTPLAASYLDLSVPGSVTAGRSFSVTATARDPFGNVATAFTGRVQLSSTDPQAPANLGTYTYTSADMGVHVFSGVTLYTAPTQTLLAFATGFTSGADLTVLPAAASVAYLVPSDYHATPGVPFSVTLYLYDAYGNPATTYTGTVHFSSDDSRAVLPPDYAFTAADAGVHSFTVTLETPFLVMLTVRDLGGAFSATAPISVF